MNINDVLTTHKYNITEYEEDINLIVFYTSKLCDAQKDIPQMIDGKRVKIVQYLAPPS